MQKIIILFFLAILLNIGMVITEAKENQKDIQTNNTIQKLIQCESRGKNIKIVDSNGYYSYGILQFQRSTWNDFSRESGIIGDPMKENDAIRMTRWAIENGYGKRWTCWKIIQKNDSI